MKRGKHSQQASQDRKKLQRHKKRYMELREELQLAGEIPTEPEGAIRDERVPPESQSDQPLPKLVGTAIRRGWAVPEEKKPALVEELIGIIDDPEAQAKAKIAAFNALRQADDSQWERDHPKEEKGSGNVVVNISVETIEKSEVMQLRNESQPIEVELIDSDGVGNTLGGTDSKQDC